MSTNKQNWDKLLESFEQSELTQKAFCQQHHINFATFKNKRYAARKKNKEAFLPVRLTNSTSAQRCELHFPSGITLRIPPAFDAEQLSCLINVVMSCG